MPNFFTTPDGQGLGDLLTGLSRLVGTVRDPDKKKREEALKYFSENPDKFQELANSSIANDPKLLEQVFGSNARFGSDKQALTRIQDQINATPLNPVEQANRVAALGSADTSNTAAISKQLAMLKSRGVDTSKFDLSKVGQGEETFLTPQQKDIRRRFLGLPTQQQESQGQATLTGSNLDNQLKQVGFDSDRIVDNYFATNPSARGRTLFELWDSNTVPEEVKNAITSSNKYAKSFDSQFSKFIESQRLDISKKGLALQEKDQALREKEIQQSWARTVFVQAADAWRQSGMIGGTAALKGFQDAFGGNPDTPEAQAALKNADVKLKTDLISKYNTQLRNLTTNEKKMSGDAIKAGIDELNSIANFLSGIGVTKQQLEYGPQQTSKGGLGGAIENKLPDLLKPNTIHTVDGGIPAPIAINTNNEDLNDPEVQADKLIQGGFSLPQVLSDPNISGEVKAAFQRKKGKSK